MAGRGIEPPPADPRIRRARPEDAAAIARVHVEAWRSAYAGLIPDAVLVGMSQRNQAMQWARTLARPRRRETVLVATGRAESVVGFGSCGPARATDARDAGEVYTLYVAPDHHGAGIGRDLLAALFGALAEQGMRSAMLWVLSLNPSRFFYEAMGGRRFAERDERMWGTVLRETGYVWDRLDRPGG